MNPRKRFLKIATGQLKGELFLPFNLNYAWFMDETLERWRREGLPADADPREFFGLDQIAFTGGAPYSPIPPFEEEVLSDEGETRLVRDHLGIIKRVWKDHESSKMPQWLDFPIKSRGDFKAFQKRLDPRSPSRWPKDWARAASDPAASSGTPSSAGSAPRTCACSSTTTRASSTKCSTTWSGFSWSW
jgi:uroporphyrinogen decarboxylase